MEVGRRTRSWMGLVLLVAVTLAVTEYILRAPNQDLASKLVTTLVNLATPATAVGLWLWKLRRPAQASRSQVERAADELAEQLRQQWEKAATERGLMFPAPIPVRWEWSRREVTGPVEAAVGRTGGARFAPVPGMETITATKLRSGTIKDLHGVYGGLDSRRLVILGAPGAGKSGAAIRLLLDALTHRATFETTEKRAGVPVPVLLPVHGWDPYNERLADWLARRLTEDYELLRAREYGRNAAASLINGHCIAVILDGLDEMPEKLRPVALRALDKQATFRLVVLTRSQEMMAAVGEGHLRGAAALELCPVEARQAARYLASTQTDPAPLPWQCLLEHLRHHPDDVLAQALQTPLMVTLVSSTYRPSDPVDELTDGQRFASREALENHLLDQVLPAAYAHSLGDRPPAYTLGQARSWLKHLARRMNADMNAEGTRELAWWQIPHWVPSWPRVLATALACGLVVELVIGAGVGLTRALVSKLGLALTIGLVIGFMGAFGERPPRHLSQLQWKKIDIHIILAVGLAVGLMYAIVNRNSLSNGPVIGVVVCLALGLMLGLGQPSTKAASPIDPLSSWRRNRQFGLVVGLVVALAYGIGQSVLVGHTALIVSWILAGLALGLAVGLVFPATWQVTLASAQLRRRGEAPVRLLRFLEDARKRDVLRTVGQVYQFRHAQLQDRLASADSLQVP